MAFLCWTKDKKFYTTKYREFQQVDISNASRDEEQSVLNSWNAKDG